MKNLIVAMSMLSIGILFTGCPYESTVPIDKPSMAINLKFLGTWEDTTHHDTYTVSKQDEFSYSIKQINNEPEENKKYIAYASQINGIDFLNVWDTESKNPVRKYSFYKMDIKSPGSINLLEITENIDEEFTSSDDLKKFIGLNMHNSYFFGKDELNLIRTGK